MDAYNETDTDEYFDETKPYDTIDGYGTTSTEPPITLKMWGLLFIFVVIAVITLLCMMCMLLLVLFGCMNSFLCIRCSRCRNDPES